MRLAALGAALALVVAACASGSTGEEIKVVVTTSILGDVVSEVVGDEARVHVLMPPGSDPHDFQASSAEVAQMASADLTVANGLGLEEGLVAVLDSLAEDGVAVLQVAPLLDPIEVRDGQEHGGGDHDSLDPHVWMDPVRMASAAEKIGEELERIHPEGGWGERAGAYADELRAAHAGIEEVLSVVPADRRVLITNHANMAYFADRHGWEVLNTIIPGGSTTGAPSSGHLAELVALIRSESVPAIFVDSNANDDVARAVAAEVREVVVVALHTDSLTDAGGEAPNLVDLLWFNARSIARAMGG